MWAYTHRSCSQGQKATWSTKCNRKYLVEMQRANQTLDRIHFLPAHRFVYYGLPDYLMQDSRWTNFTRPGLRGRGFWFWKPAILEHLLDDASVGIKDGDWVIYADGDMQDQFARLVKVSRQENASNASIDLVVQPQPHCEHVWTTGDVFARFGVSPLDPHYALKLQYKAQLFAMRVNSKTRQFVRLWTKLAEDYDLISGKSRLPNGKRFRQSREDQSLFSMLIKASWSGTPGGCTDGPQAKRGEDAYVLLANGTKVKWAPHPELGVPGLRVLIGLIGP